MQVAVVLEDASELVDKVTGLVVLLNQFFITVGGVCYLSSVVGVPVALGGSILALLFVNFGFFPWH